MANQSIVQNCGEPGSQWIKQSEESFFLTLEGGDQQLLESTEESRICFKNAILDGGSGEHVVRVTRGKFSIDLCKLIEDEKEHVKFPQISIKTPFSIGLSCGNGPVKLIAEKILTLERHDRTDCSIKFEPDETKEDHDIKDDNDHKDETDDQKVTALSSDYIEESDDENQPLLSPDRRLGPQKRRSGRRKGVSRWPLIDERLISWIDSLPDMPAKAAITQQAKTIAKDESYDNFTGSVTWVRGFMDRYHHSQGSNPSPPQRSSTRSPSKQTGMGSSDVISVGSGNSSSEPDTKKRKYKSATFVDVSLDGDELDYRKLYQREVEKRKALESRFNKLERDYEAETLKTNKLSLKLACESELTGDKEDEIVAQRDKCSLLQSKLSHIFCEFHPKSWKLHPKTQNESISKWNYKDILDHYDDWHRSHRKDTHNQICNQLDKRALRAKVEVVAEIFSTVLDEDASTDTEKVAALTDYLDELKIKSKDALAKLQHL